MNLQFITISSKFQIDQDLSAFFIWQYDNLKKMKEEQLEPRTKPTSPEKKKEEKKEGEPKLEKVNPDVPVNPLVDPSKIRQENQPVFIAAQGERKTVNREKIGQYMKRRFDSFQERVRICETIKVMFFEKQKNTKLFLKNMMKYFEDYVELYTSLYKSLGKLELKKKYQATTMYASIKQSITELVKLNDDESEHVQKFVDWLQKILAEAFKSAYNYFRERMKKINKDLENSEYKYFDCWAKQQKAYQKLSEAKDLLEKQLVLMEEIRSTNQAAIERSQDLYQAWSSILEEQNTVKKILKDNIIQFHDRFIKFHKKTDSATAIYKIWSTIPLSSSVTTVFTSFLDEKSVQYINYNSKSKKIADNFDNFMKMVYEEQRIGNPIPLLQLLTIKKFPAKQKLSQREWRDIKLIFSVDRNLLFLDEKQTKVFLKIMEHSVKLKRISENILELNGVEQGVIFDSKKKQSIHFETLDEVEQFIYFVQSIPEQKKEGQK